MALPRPADDFKEFLRLLNSTEDDREALLGEMAIVCQDFGNSFGSHRRHGYAVHKALALIFALLVQAQASQKGIMRLRMNRHAPVPEDRPNRPDSRFPQVRSALGQAVRKLCQNLLGRDQANLSHRPPRADYLRAVPIERMQHGTPIQSVRKDQPRFFFVAPWR
jgi:hypothetical protein